MAPGVSPCPGLLTPQEAAAYLRLGKNAETTFSYYRRIGLLRCTRIGRATFYLQAELDRFLVRLTDSEERQG